MILTTNVSLLFDTSCFEDFDLWTRCTNPIFLSLVISAEEIVASGRMSKEDWEECARISHALFSYGQEVAASRGLILVDTK